MGHIVRMTRVFPVQHERGKFSDQVRRSEPDVNLVAVGDSDVSAMKMCISIILAGPFSKWRSNSLSVRAEFSIVHRCLEVDVMQDGSFPEMHEQCLAVYSKITPFQLRSVICLRDIETDPHLSTSTRCHRETRRWTRCSFDSRTATSEICSCSTEVFQNLDSRRKLASCAHPTRSKTETLFPTGLSTEFPSGVKTTLPCL